jgi:hypothetical protein
MPVDEDVESAVGRNRSADQRDPLRLAGDVDLCRAGGAAGCPNVRGDPFGIASKDVCDDNFGPFGCEQACLGFTHAVGAAGNDRHFVLQAHIRPRLARAPIVGCRRHRRDLTSGGIRRYNRRRVDRRGPE